MLFKLYYIIILYAMKQRSKRGRMEFLLAAETHGSDDQLTVDRVYRGSVPISRRSGSIPILPPQLRLRPHQLPLRPSSCLCEKREGRENVGPTRWTAGLTGQSWPAGTQVWLARWLSHSVGETVGVCFFLSKLLKFSLASHLSILFKLL